jgi:hypothetical protein
MDWPERQSNRQALRTDQNRRQLVSVVRPCLMDDGRGAEQPNLQAGSAGQTKTGQVSECLENPDITTVYGETAVFTTTTQQL